jgi:hypothetical protein
MQRHAPQCYTLALWLTLQLDRLYFLGFANATQMTTSPIYSFRWPTVKLLRTLHLFPVSLCVQCGSSTFCGTLGIHSYRFNFHGELSTSFGMFSLSIVLIKLTMLVLFSCHACPLPSPWPLSCCAPTAFG